MAPTFAMVNKAALSFPDEQRAAIAINLINTLTGSTWWNRLNNRVYKLNGFVKAKKKVPVSEAELADPVLARTLSDRFFGLDCEMVAGKKDPFTGRHRLLAGRIVVVEWMADGRIEKRMDVFIKREEDEVDDGLLKKQYRWSRIRKEDLANGKDPDAVRERLLSLIRGHTLVTMAGEGDFRALGLACHEIEAECCWRELTKWWKRKKWDEEGMYVVAHEFCGLGPICEYLGYKQIIDHNCIDDASFTLRIFMEHHNRVTGEFLSDKSNPEDVISGKEYRKKHKLE